MKAFLFDLNGTMINDMQYHTEAWHEILTKDLGATLTLDEVKQEMYGKNSDVLLRVFGEGKFSEDEMHKISLEKERRYQRTYKPHLKLIPGLGKFLEKAYKQKIPMAIGSAAIMLNIDFVLDGLNIRTYFPITISADNVLNSKPDPETFLKGAQKLGIEPENCIVFEDNPKGVEAAVRGGMKSVVLTTMHQKEDFEALPNILTFIEDYTDPFLQTLLN